MEKQIEHRRYILEHFDSAIKNEYIKIWYQPIIRSMNRKISGMEILSRWEDPEIGMISPAEFIPVLEESRLIHKLDLYVLRQACSDMKQYWAKWRIMVPVSINFSRLDFELCHDLPGEITDISKAYNIPKEMLHIEITESALSTSRSFIKRELIRLEKAGYEIRLDDFGSGYSTLNSLDEYPFHVAKLDMIFMRNFGKSKNNQIIITNLISMLKDLGMRIVAEGVEIREQFEFLQEIGCDYIQGYLFCHPMPLSKILKLSKLDEKTMQEEYGMCGFERVWQDQEYYDKISSINLMHPSMISIGNDLYDLGYEFPVMIMEYKNDTFRYLRTGTGFINFLKDIQVSSLEQAEQYINDAEHPISVNMRELLNGREGSDEWLPLDFISGHNHCIGKAKVIALNVNTGAVALFCVVMNLSKYTRILEFP